MSCYSKEKMDRCDYNNICKSHSARSDRELYRICPSKLSKRELEDLYFALLENNLDLKRTINGQQDRIRGLSTKVQRLNAAQKLVQSKELKECCVGTKALVNDQKESITELKRNNQRMAERIRTLNMRLCSAKQFYKKNPQPSTSRCLRCNNVTNPSLKDAVSMRSAQTETHETQKQNTDQPCDENKCRTLMEELKVKIVNLEEELCHTHSEYSSRISRLESEVSDVRKENLRVRGERGASEHGLHTSATRASELQALYRAAEAKCAEMSAQLSIEKRKVAELETQLKAANISDRVNKTIEGHLTSKTGSKVSSITKCDCACHPGAKKSTIKPKTPDCVCACTTQPYSEELMSTPVKPKPKLPRRPTGYPRISPKVPETEMTSPPADTDLPPIEARETEVTQATPQETQKATIPTLLSKLFEPKGSDCACACPPRPDYDTRDSNNTKGSECVCACQPRDNEAPGSLSIKGSTCLCLCPSRQALGPKDFIASKGSNNVCGCPPPLVQDESTPIQNEVQERTPRFHPKPPDLSLSPLMSNEIEKPLKLLDDSGYNDKSQDISDDMGVNKMNQELIKKIVELQSQVDRMRISGARELPVVKQSQPNETAETSTSLMTTSYDKNKTVSNPETVADETCDIKCGKRQSKTADNRNLSTPKLSMVEGGCQYKPGVKSCKRMFTNLEEIDSATPDINQNARLQILEDCESLKTSDINEHQSKSELIFGSRDDVKPSSDEPENTNKNDFNFGNLDFAKNENGVFAKTESPENIKMITEERRSSKPKMMSNLMADESRLALTNNEDLPMIRPTPVEDDLIATKQGNRNANNENDAPTRKGTCERCEACTYERECEARPFINSQEAKTAEASAKIAQMIKNDRHNSLQIPGPIPVSENENKDWKKNVFKRFSISKKTEAHKNKDKNGKEKKEALNKDIANETEKPLDLRNYSQTTDIIAAADALNRRQEQQAMINLEKEEDIRALREPPKSFGIPSKESIEMNKHILAAKDNNAVPLQESLHNYYGQSDHALLPISLPIPYDTNEQRTQIKKIDESPRVPTYQETTYQEQDKSIQVEVPNESAQPRKIRRVSSLSDQETETIDTSKQTRGTSPDNTECEISYMTDLPSERDAKSPIKSRPLSPGEEKATTTYTESYTSPVTNYSFSEGELPAAATVRKTSKVVAQGPDSTPAVPDDPPAQQKMEEALQAITDELTRCKKLMLSQRPTETAERASGTVPSSSLEQEPSDQPIALRRGVATQSIGDTYAPKCIFTLHIGTVVLSDEAVLNSRNKSLVMTWKFYDQNIAMTRVRAGRVVLFDFSTEYDIKITDEFLNYMKHEEMPIIICELDKQDQPFATCALPLRDALLHTNRRADMSLALVAGPQILNARAANSATADALDAGDEMGVIDLWCMLRADGKLLPLINRAIARPGPPVNKSQQYSRHNSRVMQQVIDDEPSNEFVDLDLTLVNRIGAPVPVGETTGHNEYKDVEYMRTSRKWGSSMLKLPCTIDIDAVTQTPPAPVRDEEIYDASKYPPVRRYSEPKPAYLPPLRRERDTSRIIPNEVIAKIKSPGDMRQALEQSTMQSEFTRLAKSEEEITSQAHSSIGSLRSIMARLQKRGLRNMSQKTADASRRMSLLQTMGKIGKNVLEAPNVPPESSPSSEQKMLAEDTTDMDIYRKYDNISKLLGSNKAETSKKSVTIVPKYIEPATIIDEAPQKDVAEDQNPEEISKRSSQCLDITVLWLALNEECEAMVDRHVQRLYVSYSFLGRNGAELETPVSLPKPKHYVDKCYFNFKKTFQLEDSDLPLLGHMARCRAASKLSEDAKDCIVFTVVSEPPEDPLGLESCEDIGYAFLYLGDLLAYSAGSSGYTEVVPVRAARGGAAVCGVLAVRLDGLDVVRRCLLLSNSQRNLADWTNR